MNTDARAVLSDAPLSVCWDITNICNDKCAFCYRIVGRTELDTASHMVILDHLLRSGVRKISFVGGEPLTVPHLPYLLARCREYGVSTSITTNGILLQKRWPEINRFLDWIALPLDGSNDNLQQRMTRRAGHVSSVLSAASMLRDAGIGIKINTVVSSMNCGDMDQIGRIVITIGAKRWKLFRFLPIRGAAMMHNEMFSIDEAGFRESAAVAISICNESPCIVTVAGWEELEQTHFSISPDGSVRTTIGMKDVMVGNLLSSDVASIWNSGMFDKKQHFDLRYWLV
jgi:MoaA/NifB/PqqE/SkfB family radical SAM enzyme